MSSNLEKLLRKVNKIKLCLFVIDDFPTKKKVTDKVVQFSVTFANQ